MMIEELSNRSRGRIAEAAANRINSRDLFRNRQRLEIEHRGEIYRLQITRQGKLILTK
jgi:hemin uptake protein HemP